MKSFNLICKTSIGFMQNQRRQKTQRCTAPLPPHDEDTYSWMICIGMDRTNDQTSKPLLYYRQQSRKTICTVDAHKSTAWHEDINSDTKPTFQIFRRDRMLSTDLRTVGR